MPVSYARRENNEETYHRSHCHRLYRPVCRCAGAERNGRVNPTLTPTATVCAAETAVAEPEPEEESVPTENKISLVPQMEASQESLIVLEPEPEPIEIPTAFETLPVQEQTSAPAPMQ